MKTSVLIDSHGWIEYFSEGPKAQRYAAYIESWQLYRLIVPSIVLYEVYKRLKSTKGETAALEAIAHIIEHTETISVDQKTALNAAEISLRTKLPMADAIIKAVAEDNEADLITGDPHFKNLPNVVFIE